MRRQFTLPGGPSRFVPESPTAAPRVLLEAFRLHARMRPVGQGP